MKNEIIKYVGIILLIIGACVLLTRTLTKSETVADYASKHVEVEIEAIPTAEVEKEKVPFEPFVEAQITEVVPLEDADEIIAEDENGPEADSFYIEEISEELKERMRGKSYADGIDESLVNFDMLRHIVLRYNNFDGDIAYGEIVCSELIAQDLLEIFEELYYAGYQFEEISLIDKYDADDDASMEANNTSCFNYRVVDNTTKLSYHAYGLAIDVNPFYNPYVQFRNGADYICPEASAEYADRTADFPYKIDENDLAYKLFKEHGFTWGGNWNSCKDYQHFEKRLR